MSEEQAFKRINFFKGFVTTTKDWNDAENYHVEKHRLHNRCFHGAGVVPGYKQDFVVQARGRADMSVEVNPGYAIDGRGNDLMLWETEIKSIDKSDFKLPATLYFVARYVEEYTDFIAYKENLDFKGHRRIAEKVVVDVTITEPNINNEVEIGRVFLTEDAKKITDAKTPENPGPNEIDLRFVPTAGVVGGFLPTELIVRLLKLIKAQRVSYYALARDRKVLSANAVSLGLMTIEILLESGSVGPNNVMKILASIGELENEMIDEIESTKPSLKAMKDFGQFKHSVDVFRDVLKTEPLLVDDNGLANFDSLDQVITLREKSMVPLQNIVGEQQLSLIEEEDAGSFFENWEKYKVFSGELPETILVDGQEWTLIDTININDNDSEDAHSFKMENTRDSWKARQHIRYPDGVVVEDTGIAHEGGQASYQILGVTPNRPIVILRRTDIVRSEYEIEFFVDDVRVGVSQCLESDRRFRWRNWPFLIPAEYVKEETITIIQKALTAERDINMFHYWFYQAL